MDNDQYSEQETQRRMEAAIRRAQKTPHKPHAAKIKKKLSRTRKAKKSA